jgi:hypothetical protein
MQWDSAVFISTLKALASQTDAEMNPLIMEVWEDEMKQYGWEKVYGGFRSIMLTGIKKFPTIPEFKKAMGVAVEIPLTSMQMANVLSQKLFKAVGKFGPEWVNEAKSFVGEVAWEYVIECNGWANYCRLFDPPARVEDVITRSMYWLDARITNPVAVKNIASLAIGNGKLPDEVTKLIASGGGMKLAKKETHDS